MRYRRLGQAGVKVSTVSLGSWLTYGGSVERDAAAACVRAALDVGVNFVDTANVYGRGAAEEVVGAALRGVDRDAYVLATKVFFPMGERPNDRGLSRYHVEAQITASLRRLGVDHVDLYQCHRHDPDTPLEETCATMADLIARGHVRYWGVSEWSADQISHAVTTCRAHGWPQPVSNQPQYSALWRRIEQGVLPTSVAHGLGQVVWSPLAMGVLTGKYTSVDDAPAGSRAAGDDANFMRAFWRQEVLDAVAVLRATADEAACTLGQLALAWCLRHDGVSSTIIGATRPEQVTENAAAADLDLDPVLLERVGATLADVAAS